MMSGHFATALVANQRLPKSSLFFLLVASVFPDLLWMLFHYLGLEPTSPTDLFSTSLQSISANMLYSHDLLPQIVWVLLFFVIGKLLYKDNKIALMGSALVFGHFLLDLLSGFPHFVFGTDSQNISLGLYKSNVYLAIFIEFIFTAVLLAYFFKNEKTMGISRTKKNYFSLIGIFAFGIIFFIVIGVRSLRDLLNLPEIDIPFNTTMIGLIATFAFMLISINIFTSQTITEN